MAAFVGATVIHRCRVNERRGIGLTACGIRFRLSDTRYDPNGAFTEGYADWLNEKIPIGPRGYRSGRFLKSQCNHCHQREPAWKRLRRVKLRKRRRKLRE